MNLALVSFNCKQGSHYLKYLPRLPICSPCFGQLWHTFRAESEKLFAPRTRAAESMSNQAAFAICSTERYFSMRPSKEMLLNYLLSSRSVCSSLLATRTTTPTSKRTDACGNRRTYNKNSNQYAKLFQKDAAHITNSQTCIPLSYRHIKQYF